jgi:thiol-disulfide isomerase/thioredoxin
MPRNWIYQVCILWAVIAILSQVSALARAETPTAAQALALTPIQPNVNYTRPDPKEAAHCTIRAEKQAGVTAWVVRDSQGQTLRRFADTNADNVVDLWCYFNGGLEVYRDIDADHDGKADQYRWLQTAGTRWGIDKKQNGHIDYWQVISAPEVAEELVWALKTKDQKRFELLLLTSDELAGAGFNKQQTDKFAAAIKAAPAAFSKLAAEQKVVTSQTDFADFYRSRPATIPAGTDGSTKDVTILDNASALVETGDKHDQLFMGTMVSVGQTWKLLDVPTIGADAQTPQSGLLTANPPDAEGAGAAAGGPSDEMQQLMAELEKLDQQADKAAPDDQTAATDRRAEVLQRLASLATDDDSRNDWLKQMADVLSAAVQTGSYPQGIAALGQLVDKLAKDNPNDTVIPYVKFRKMWAEYSQSQQVKDADLAKIQEKWLADLESFANDNPKSVDAAEALLQLGMANEFGGHSDDAQKWYQKLADGFPKSSQASTARGALTRLGSKGKSIVFRASDLKKRNIDLSAPPYRGKVVAIYYWATWCDHCKERLDALNDLYAKWGGRGFDVIGVCLDKSPDTMQSFLTANQDKTNPYKWVQVYDAGGRLSNEMGVMTLPLMILVDQKGAVVSDNIYVDGLEPELQRLLGTTTAQGTGALPTK